MAMQVDDEDDPELAIALAMSMGLPPPGTTAARASAAAAARAAGPSPASPSPASPPGGRLGPPTGQLVPGAELRARPPGKAGTYTGTVMAVDDGALTVQFRGLDEPVLLPAGHAIEFPIGSAAPPSAPADAGQQRRRPPPAPKPPPVRPPSDLLTLEETERLLGQGKAAHETFARRLCAALSIQKAEWLWFDEKIHSRRGSSDGNVLRAPAAAAGAAGRSPPEDGLPGPATPGAHTPLQPRDWPGRAGSWHDALDEVSEERQERPQGSKPPAVPPLGLDLPRSIAMWDTLHREARDTLLPLLRALTQQCADRADGKSDAASWPQELERESTTLRGPGPYDYPSEFGPTKDAMPYLTWRLARLVALLLASPTVFSDVECCGALCLLIARIRPLVSPALAHLMSHYDALELSATLRRLQDFLGNQVSRGIPALATAPPLQVTLVDQTGEKIRLDRATALNLMMTFPDGTKARCRGLCWEPEQRLLRCRIVLDKDTGGDRRAEATTSIPLRANQLEHSLEETIRHVAAMAESEHTKHNLRMGPHSAAAASSIGVVYHANFLWKSQGVVCYEEFYNKEVNSNLDAEVEVHRWLARKKKFGKNMRFTPGDFSFAEAPYLLDPAFKAELLNASSRVEQRQQVERGGATDILALLFGGMEAMFLHLEIDRTSTQTLVDSTLRELTIHSDQIRYPLRVRFTGHAGLDAGGLRKEWFQLLQVAIFDPAYGMFTEDPETKVTWFQPRLICSDCDRQFNLIGQLLGLALYNGIILDLNFPPVTYKRLLGQEPVFTDLKRLDRRLYANLEKLLSWDEEAEGASVEDTFSLTFAVSHEVFGMVQEEELKPGGGSIPVTKENRFEYAALVAQYKCRDSIAQNFDEFRRGFLFVCGDQQSVLTMLRPEELERMVVGNPDIDLGQLRAGARYEGYRPDAQVVRWFWEVVAEMRGELQQRRFLRFCTGTDRVPIHGLGSYSFTVMRHGDDSEALPSASTCFYVLKLPEYSSKDKLRRKLALAISECTGFGLE
eukprot:TRINITY_DN69948_c0_g1_i1.p1 TRINITY_DN69948_c0_g1~~TRINITY_DN69948_c0_g1_i1.p1  ORF type:complete len:1056 (+),score=311.51 TRINITY_DN69948_c0_g1_i1:125-3169(+)